MRRILPLLVLLCVAFAPAPLPKQRRADDGPRDLEAMQGVWADRFADSSAVTIAGDRTEYSPDQAWKITLNGRTNPKRIEAAGLGSEVVGKTRSGIYRLEEGKLIVCWRCQSADELEWPASLDPIQKDVWIEVFARVKR